jgi:hypothetical protein
MHHLVSTLQFSFVLFDSNFCIGSGSVEGLNQRLQVMVKERTRSGLEAFIHELKKEADFFDKVITNEQVFSDRKKTHDANVRKHLGKKKAKLQHIMAYRVHHHHTGITLDEATTTTTTSTSSSITFTAASTEISSSTFDSSPPPLIDETSSIPRLPEVPLYDDLFSDKALEDECDDDNIVDLVSPPSIRSPIVTPNNTSDKRPPPCNVCGSEYVIVCFSFFFTNAI